MYYELKPACSPRSPPPGTVPDPVPIRPGKGPSSKLPECPGRGLSQHTRSGGAMTLCLLVCPASPGWRAFQSPACSRCLMNASAASMPSLPPAGTEGGSTVSSPFPWKVCLKKTGLRVTSTEAAFFHPELSPQEKGLVAKRKEVMQIKTWTSDLPPRRGGVPACMCQGSYPAWVGRCSGWKQADQGAVKSLGAAPLHPWELTCDSGPKPQAAASGCGHVPISEGLPPASGGSRRPPSSCP